MNLNAMFAAAVTAGPARPAVTAGAETLSYSELDGRAKRVASQLRQLGVAPEEAVAVRMSPSAEMLVSLLGVLRAGCAYLPIELGFPERRVALMMREANVRFLLAPDGLHGTEEGIVRVGTGRIHGDGLAYITYTSGSSGTPKAVGTTHASASAYLHALAEADYVRHDDITLQVAAPSFDASIRDTLGPLLVGAHVVLPIGPEGRDPAAQRGLMLRYGVTCILGMVPTLLRLLIAEAGPPVPSLRRILVSGEPLNADDVRRARASLGSGVTVVNHYGPTECTMTTSFQVVAPGDDPGTGQVPIGAPLPGTTVYVLDEDLYPVPQGETGQLYIGGTGVTRGYLNAPEATAARFVPDPFGARPGARMYRTGDLGRCRPDGVLEYLGRVDRQLKIHGVRVEPNEVESVLLTHPGVREVAVTAVGSALCAHVGHGSNPAPSERDLREHARRALPDALVPSRYVFLPDLPHTSSGKIDHRNLPAPAPAQPTGALAMADSDQAVMLAIWRDLLAEPRLGVHDDFFAFGGDSLLALRLLSRIRREWGRAPGLGDFFAAPTVAETAAMLPDADGPADPIAVRAVPTSQGALSFAQEQLWFFEQLLPGTPMNTIPAGFLADGCLDRAALTAALQDVLTRHPTLRTCFRSDQGRPSCEPGPDQSRALGIVDLSPGADPVVAMTDLAHRPLDLEQGPLLDLTVFEDTGRTVALLLRAHHLVADAWSMELILNELSASYQARLADGEPAMSTDQMAYAEYADRQRVRFTAGEVERQMMFWREELHDAPPVLDLPLDRSRPAVRRYRGGVYTRRLPADLLTAATELARAEGTTLFMVLLTAWATLLHRYSGQDDLVIGVPMSGRTEMEYEPLVGLFVNTLPVRLRLADEPAFNDLLAQVTNATVRAMEHQDFPLERLVEELRPVRSLSHSPLFQVLADYQVAPVPQLPGLSLRPVDVHTGMARFDLSVSFIRRVDAVDAVHTFDLHLFDVATVERMCDHLTQVLTEGLRHPSRAVTRLAILSAAERNRLTGPQPPAPTNPPSVIAAFAEHVAATPERTALISGDTRITYGELSTAVERTARMLRTLGVEHETPVGVVAEAGPGLVAGLLGILAAGGAYVPLDPAYPAERLSDVLDDAGVRLILTQAGLEDRLPPGISSRVLPGFGNGPAAMLQVRPQSPDRLAYIIHTSGSTGRPKGVEVTHRGLANVLDSLARRIGFTSDDVLLAVTTISFDIAALELFLPLVSGAQVVLSSRDQARDPVLLRRLLSDSEATVIQATPTTWRALVEAPGPPVRLRVALCGGEALPADLTGRLFDLAETVVNVYGPTETTIWSSAARLDPSDPRPPSLGEPIADTRVLVLDRYLEPVPPGVVGEIYVGGAGVARGYRGRSDLTASRFLPDPHAARPGERLYRTGDRGRRDADGRLEFLGRTDRQFKIHGFRVEPGEVETVLLSHPLISGAVVTVDCSPAGTCRLVAYLVAIDRTAESVGTDVLQSFVARRLPAYMVPSVLVYLDRMPLTPNGKINLGALPEPGRMRPTLTADYVPADPGLQAGLATIWSSVLGVDAVGVHDDFFALGGNSLLAVQIMARVNDAYGTDLALNLLFSDATVAGLARRVEEEVIRQLLADPS